MISHNRLDMIGNNHPCNHLCNCPSRYPSIGLYKFYSIHQNNCLHMLCNSHYNIWNHNHRCMKWIDIP